MSQPNTSKGYRKPVQIHNLVNKITLDFPSHHAAASYLGTDASHVGEIIRTNRTDNRFRGEWIIKDKNDPRTFHQIRDAAIPRKCNGRIQIAVKDLITDEVRYYVGFTALEVGEGIGERSAVRRLRYNVPVPVRSKLLLVGSEKNPPNWPKYSEWVLDLYRKYKFQKPFFFKLTDPKGNVSYWESYAELEGSVTGSSRCTLRSGMQRGGKWSGYIVEKIQLVDHMEIPEPT